MNFQVGRLKEDEIAVYSQTVQSIHLQNNSLLFTGCELEDPGSCRPFFCPDKLASELKSPFIWHYFVQGSHGPVGFLRFERGISERVAHRGDFSMGVKREFWGNGAGDLLLNRLETDAAKAGIIRIELSVLESNLRAQRVYLRRGYRFEGKKELSFRVGEKFESGFWMAKLL